MDDASVDFICDPFFVFRPAIADPLEVIGEGDLWNILVLLVGRSAPEHEGPSLSNFIRQGCVSTRGAMFWMLCALLHSVSLESQNISRFLFLQCFS